MFFRFELESFAAQWRFYNSTVFISSVNNLSFYEKMIFFFSNIASQMLKNNYL